MPNNNNNLDFRLSSGFEYCMCSFGDIPNRTHTIIIIIIILLQGFELAIPASGRSQTHPLAGAPTGIGFELSWGTYCVHRCFLYLTVSVQSHYRSVQACNGTALPLPTLGFEYLTICARFQCTNCNVQSVLLLVGQLDA